MHAVLTLGCLGLMAALAMAFPMSGELIRDRLNHINNKHNQHNNANTNNNNHNNIQRNNIDPNLTPAMQLVLNQQVEAIKSQLLAAEGLGSGLANCQTELSEQYFDLSALGGSDIAGSDPQYGYKLNVCGQVNDPSCAAKAGSLCQFNPAGGYVHMLCSWTGTPAPVWSLIDPADATKGVIVTFANGDLCYNSGQTSPRGVALTFPCNPSASGAPSFTFATNPSNPCSYTVTMAASAAACPSSSPAGGGDGPSKGLSGGSVFLIILVVVLPIYIVGGCLFKRQRMGTTGMESCPNIDFWRAIPGLVKDGCQWTWGKLRGNSANTSYETVK